MLKPKVTKLSIANEILKTSTNIAKLLDQNDQKIVSKEKSIDSLTSAISQQEKQKAELIAENAEIEVMQAQVTAMLETINKSQ